MAISLFFRLIAFFLLKEDKCGRCVNNLVKIAKKKRMTTF